MQRTVGGGGNYVAHYQAVTAAQSQGPGGVGSVGYVEVAGNEYGVVFLLFVMRDKVGVNGGIIPPCVSRHLAGKHR